MKQKLTIKQEKACRKFVEVGDKSAAYRFAYNTQNMKIETVHRKAFELFEENGKVAARILELRDELGERNDITQDRVLREYAKLGFSDPRKFYDNEGNLIPIHKLPADVAATLTGMDVQTIYTKDGDMMGDLKKIKFADKKAALDSIAKHLGMFIDRVQVGMDEAQLNVLLAGMAEIDPERAEAVKKALIGLAMKKKKV